MTALTDQPQSLIDSQLKMPTSVSRTSANSGFSRFTGVIGPSAPHLALFTVCLLLLLYGYEIFNFSLSIDEEVHSRELALAGGITQGRWAIGGLARVFPPLGNMPMLSTVLFCGGLGLTACILARVLFRRHAAQWAFAGIFVSSPLWPHIAEFNTISWGFGIGCVLLTFALLLTLAERRFGDIGAACLLAFATGIYQSFYAWFLVLLCIRHLSVLLGTAPDDETKAGEEFPWLRSGLVAVGGLLGYLAVARLLLAAFSLQLSYVQGYVRLAEFTTGPAPAFRQTLLRIWNLLTGADPIYLGYGHLVTPLSLLGLLIVVITLFARKRLRPSQRLLGGASLVAGLLIAISPILVSAGTAPARSLISWIPFGAFLAGVTLSNKSRFEKPLYCLLVAALFLSIWVSVSLFYVDHIARERDLLLAARIMARVDQIITDPPPGPIPFVVIGAPPKKDDTLQKTEIFGYSFFEFQGGNPYRISAYLHLLGVDRMEVHLIEEVVPLRPVIEAMPVWPAPGSIAMVKGMLIIKLGPLPPA
jgi:hypothetical protein